MTLCVNLNFVLIIMRARTRQTHAQIARGSFLKGRISSVTDTNRCTPQRIAMAEALDPSDKRLEELEEEITCTVCHGHYQDRGGGSQL